MAFFIISAHKWINETFARIIIILSIIAIAHMFGLHFNWRAIKDEIKTKIVYVVSFLWYVFDKNKEMMMIRVNEGAYSIQTHITSTMEREERKKESNWTFHFFFNSTIAQQTESNKIYYTEQCVYTYTLLLFYFKIFVEFLFGLSIDPFIHKLMKRQ